MISRLSHLEEGRYYVIRRHELMPPQVFLLERKYLVGSALGSSILEGVLFVMGAGRQFRLPNWRTSCELVGVWEENKPDVAPKELGCWLEEIPQEAVRALRKAGYEYAEAVGSDPLPRLGPGDQAGQFGANGRLPRS